MLSKKFLYSFSALSSPIEAASLVLTRPFSGYLIKKSRHRSSNEIVLSDFSQIGDLIGRTFLSGISIFAETACPPRPRSGPGPVGSESLGYPCLGSSGQASGPTLRAGASLRSLHAWASGHGILSHFADEGQDEQPWQCQFIWFFVLIKTNGHLRVSFSRLRAIRSK